ncbi:DUF3265 domain-containing protein [Vibrio parahaemolyticus]|uniref:DUF3265 domain-containing protein n=1 Tax=Vibrio parahaemolyticus TaxID=670 RepID=A0A7Z2MTF6_VIBPH|nr:DUF3265 domain-containing protein [Vibrio parahaemolyticus]ELV8719546.1 DUF3265 domain-containing protein [Vibrio vulnificus]MCQ9053374.1 DUF3265 domain-containing protein [Vibrio diabolicus]EGR2568494.1 DUF3265 domain-containing protein [Vibrio parahaemolyticus]EHK0753146.1 DUF3265 domain-containing protein [Vibrio parahaemolyticus]
MGNDIFLLLNVDGTNITNCLRGIRNAWHFYYALSLVVMVVCGYFCIALLTP